MSWDRTIVLQPGQQEQNSASKKGQCIEKQAKTLNLKYTEQEAQTASEHGEWALPLQSEI